MGLRISKKNGYLEVILPGGTITKIDQKDRWITEVFPWWSFNGKYIFVKRCIPTEYGVANEAYPLARLIAMKGKKKFEVDHINGDKLDNRSANLRWCTRSQNCANHAGYKTNKKTSKYRGVRCRQRKSGAPIRWYAYGVRKGKAVHLGTFDTEEEAAGAYNAYAKERFGEFAWQNDVGVA